jgi:hypothetical protein
MESISNKVFTIEEFRRFLDPLTLNMIIYNRFQAITTYVGLFFKFHDYEMSQNQSQPSLIIFKGDNIEVKMINLMNHVIIYCHKNNQTLRFQFE